MKIGFACGVFDLFHAGHVLMLQECKCNCDFLIVALNEGISLTNDKNNPIYSINERKIILESCKYVDKVLTYSSESELSNIIQENNIDIRFLGDDYQDGKKNITASELSKEIYIISRNHGISTSKIRETILNSGK